MDFDKSRLRREFSDRRKALSVEERSAGSQKICDYIRQLPEFRRCSCVGAFSALGPEPDLQSLFGSKRWFLPRFNQVEQLYEMVEITDPSSQLVIGKYGICEPHPELPAASAKWCRQELLYLIPAVSCARNGVRLGRGGGYYDRLLSGNIQAHVGVIFSCQLAEELPRCDHDIVMDLIVTEQEIINCRSSVAGAVPEESE